jgi:hypothetical protein
LLGWALAACIFAILAAAADGRFSVGAAEEPAFRLEPLEEAAPQEVSAAVREALVAKGSRILDAGGKPFADFWLAKSVAAGTPRAEFGVRFDTLLEGGLVACVRFHGKASDFKTQDFGAGVYTCRYAIQPQDGDHMGVTDTRDFLLLVPAKDDPSPEEVAVKSLVELSTKVSDSKHPAVLYLVKRAGEEQGVPRVVEDKGLGLWLFECDATLSAKEAKPLRLSIVIRGSAPGL